MSSALVVIIWEFFKGMEQQDFPRKCSCGSLSRLTDSSGFRRIWWPDGEIVNVMAGTTASNQCVCNFEWTKHTLNSVAKIVRRVCFQLSHSLATIFCYRFDLYKSKTRMVLSKLKHILNIGFSLENKGFLTKCYNLSNFSEHISCSKIDFKE